MQLSRNILGLVALFGASMVSVDAAVDGVAQATAKPLVVRKGGMFTATLEVVFTDTDFELLPTKRILTNNNKQHNKLKYKNDNSTDDTVFVTAFFMNNFFDVPELLPASKSNNKTYTSKDTKPGSHSKSTDDLQFKSAKLWPNFRPKVDAEVSTIDGGDVIASATKDEPKSTVVQWKLPIDDIEEGKKYKFDVKIKVGPNVDSKEMLMVDWTVGANDLSDESEIVVK